jgi:glucose-6-phosphate isomerase
LTHPTRGRGTTLPAAWAAQAEVTDLIGRQMGDLVDAEARASYDTLVAAGRPVRLIEMPAINEFEIGGLLMHFMLETILTADILQIDAFDQPEVEAGKIRAKHYMQSVSSQENHD